MIWKDIEGYDYQVSDEGEVRSKDRWNNTSHNAVRYLKGKIIKQHEINSGYVVVHLHKDGKFKSILVHRLVYETFVGEIPKGMTINHINENKKDNRLSNLNLMTHKENANWGTKPTKTRQHIKTLKKRVVCIKDDEEYMSFFSKTDAAKHFNTTVQNISYAVKTGARACGYYWKEITAVF